MIVWAAFYQFMKSLIHLMLEKLSIMHNYKHITMKTTLFFDPEMI